MRKAMAITGSKRLARVIEIIKVSREKEGKREKRVFLTPSPARLIPLAVFPRLRNISSDGRKIPTHSRETLVHPQYSITPGIYPRGGKYLAAGKGGVSQPSEAEGGRFVRLNNCSVSQTRGATSTAGSYSSFFHLFGAARLVQTPSESREFQAFRGKESACGSLSLSLSLSLSVFLFVDCFILLIGRQLDAIDDSLTLPASNL